MKTVNLFLIACLYMTSHLPVYAQTDYKAALLVKKGKTVDTEPVEVRLENGAVKISRKKPPLTAKLIPIAEIKSVEYSYSDKPRYTVATLSTLAIGITALPLFATKTKKNWLTIIAEKEVLLLQLQGDNYQMLLLEMNKLGVKISDSGDRDRKDKDNSEVEKTGENKKSKNK